MTFVGNLLWFLLGGFALGLGWIVAGIFWCITLIGIPFGIACFRISRFAFFPFGKELVPAELVGEKAPAGSSLMNFLWCIFSGLWFAISYTLLGVVLCCTIIGIPFGLAEFKLAQAVFAPLGKRVVSSEVAKAARERAAQQAVDGKFSDGASAAK